MEKEHNTTRLIENVIDDGIRLFKRCVKGLIILALGAFIGYYYHEYHPEIREPNITNNYTYTRQVLLVPLVLPKSLPSTGANQ